MPAFVPVHPPRNPDECAPWLYEALQRLNRAATSSFQATASIVRNETPDSSGQPLVDLSQYFFLPGRSGGQIARGDTSANGSLTLSSTNSSTKGKIFLGTAHGSAFDEANNFLGLGTSTPSARLHLFLDTNGLYVKFEPGTFTVVTCTIAGDGVTVTTAASFTSPTRIQAGMTVSGTGIPANTVILRLNAGGSFTLSNASTPGAGLTLTFGTATNIERVSDETAGIDLLFRSKSGIRFVTGPPNGSIDVPFSLRGDFSSPVAGVAALNRVFLETGYITGGSAVGTELQIGGPGHGELRNLYFSSRFYWFGRNPASGTNPQVGISENPFEYGSTAGPDTALLIGTSNNTNGVVIYAGSATNFLVCGGSATGSSPSKAVDVTLPIMKVTTSGQLHIGGAGGSAYFTGNNTSISLFRNSDATLMFSINSTQATWTDSASTYAVGWGNFATNKKVMHASSGSGVLDRFGVGSIYTAIGSNRTIGVPSPAATPDVLFVFNGDLDGVDGQVLLALKTLRAGQTGNLLENRISTGEIKSGFDNVGSYFGDTHQVFIDDEIVSYEDDSVWY